MSLHRYSAQSSLTTSMAGLDTRIGCLLPPPLTAGRKLCECEACNRALAAGCELPAVFSSDRVDVTRAAYLRTGVVLNVVFDLLAAVCPVLNIPPPETPYVLALIVL